MTKANPIAVVTGANRGLGLEISRQLARKGFHVIMTARDLAKGAAALHPLASDGLEVELRKVDVSRADDARALAQYIKETHGRVDVLINNAGIFMESSRRGSNAPADPMLVSPTTVMETLNVNTLGPMRLIQALAPLMPEGGRIVNLSSGMGALTDMGENYLAYRMSKTALNALTRVFARALAERGIRVNAVCPGWVRTDMGGPNATLSMEQGADTAVWLATDPAATASGEFFRDRKSIPW